MKITWFTSLIGSLALIGTPFFSGFYSKDSIIGAVLESEIPGAGFAQFAVMAGVFVTAFYSFRMFFLVFHGKERFHEVQHDTHAGHDALDSHTPHESPWVVTLPLILLAIPSLLIGYFALEPMLVGDFFKNVITVDAVKHPALAEFVKAHVEHGPVAMALHGFVTPVFWLAAAGVATAWYFYLVKPAVPAWFMARFGGVYRLLDNKYYMDKINEVVFAGGSRALGTGLWQGGDVRVIDGAVVNGSARLVGWFASVIRYLQSGLLSQYAFAMILGIVLLLAYFTVLR